jgi:hypothetical protein
VVELDSGDTDDDLSSSSSSSITILEEEGGKSGADVNASFVRTVAEKWKRQNIGVNLFFLIFILRLF